MTSLPYCLILSRRPFLCAEPQTHAAYLTLARTRRRRGSSPARPLPGGGPPRPAALPGDGPPRRAGAARSTAREREPRAPPPLESSHAPPLRGSSAQPCVGAPPPAPPAQPCMEPPPSARRAPAAAPPGRRPSSRAWTATARAASSSRRGA